jgi:hypothetical protein
MNWIKSNPFVSLLVGITVVLCGLLFFIASNAGSKYAEDKEAFDQAFNDVSSFERNDVYPKKTNVDAKMKALSDYRESIVKLREGFAKYQVEKIENIPTEAFTDRLTQTNQEVSKAFADVNCEIPEGFFLGFDAYSNRAANSDATGMLSYQLDGIKNALLLLAKAGPSVLLSVSRDVIPEESGAQPTPGPDAVSRGFGYEVTFKGTEPVARKFLSALGEMKTHYYVVRCVRIKNEKNVPPKISDSDFETEVVEKEEAPDGNALFDIFERPEEPEKPEEADVVDVAVPEGGDKEGDVPAPEPVAPPENADSSRILAQVLGDEEVIVFVRFDITMFLAHKELPKP